MHTLRLQVNERIYRKLLVFLSRFDQDEIQIVHENDEFKHIQAYLNQELIDLETHKQEMIDFEDLDNSLEQRIKKHEA